VAAAAVPGYFSGLAGGRFVVFLEQPWIDLSTDLTEEMAPHVFVSEDPIRVHFRHSGNKVVIFGVEAA